MRYTVSVERTFSAAHALRGYRGRCERLHGHNWKVRLSVSGRKLNGTGMVVDFAELRALLEEVLAALDHRYLNEVPPFDKTNPTAENIASYIFYKIKKEGVNVASVTVWESETSSATVE